MTALCVPRIDYGASMSAAADLSPVVEAVRGLELRPRQRQWVSLSLCIVDAVYSIGAHYDRHVLPVVRRIAADAGIETPSVPPPVTDLADPLPLERFLDRYDTVDALLAVTNNRQRTSPRGGILKAEAVLQYVTILHEYGIRTLDDARVLLDDPQRLDTVETALRTVPGEGGFGVRRGYLWMLVGDEDTVKPDRMVLGWLARHGADVNAATARILLSELATEISRVLGRRVTAWEIDHAIWISARSVRAELRSDQEEPRSQDRSIDPDAGGVDAAGELADIRDRLDTVLATLGGQSSRRVVVDLDDPDEPDLHFVLTAALREWADDLRHQVQDDPEHPNRADLLRWAEAADRLHERIDEAL